MALQELGFQNGTITFDEPKSVFYSGQVVSGKINFALSTQLTISGIDVFYIGEANVEWTEEQEETYGGVKRKKVLKYMGHEDYCNYIQRLTQGITVLPAGSHSIPFSQQIPLEAPSSFKGVKGQITYKVKAHLIHEDGVTKEEIVQEFNVVAPLNLNTCNNDVKTPLVMEFEEILSCQCFCASKTLAIAIKLPAHGYCPGQIIPVIVDARNETNVEVSKIVFQITTRERYHSQRPPSEYEPPEEILTTLKKGPILSNTTKEYQFEVKVPDFVAPNLESCSIIDVGFFFKVMMKLSGCNDDIEDEAEICIGLIPLGERLDVRMHPMIESLPTGPVPDPNNPQIHNYPPAYKPNYAPNENLIQICPPGPIPYPAVANVVDKPIFSSKNNFAGPFEYGSRSPDQTHPGHTIPMPLPSFPNLPQGTNIPYPLQPPPFGTQPSAPPSY